MTATRTDTHILDAHDWAPHLPCEHRQHPPTHIEHDPARWHIRTRCPRCRHTRAYLLCESGRLRMRPPANLGCTQCGYVTDWDHAVIACDPLPEAGAA